MNTEGAPGSTQSLSAVQFSTAALPAAHSGLRHEPHNQPEPNGIPLASQASTFGSAKGAATWRKPTGVMPLSKATIGSTFTPF